MLRGGAGVIFGFFVAFLALLLACPALAQVSGPCSNCHTMHNSQDGDNVFADGPYPELLVKDCVGCHSATDGDTWKDPVTGAPIVYNTSEPTYGADAGDGQKQGLAAGNFYWVDQDDTFGHNIFSPDANLDVAPGAEFTCSNNSCHRNLDRPLWGYSGCRSCHMVNYKLYDDPVRNRKYHHADDSATIINSQEQGWYRFLNEHTEESGVHGIEDPDWQYTASSTDHNEYFGERRRAGFDEEYSVTAFCYGCHWNFKTYQYVSPYYKHPADIVIPNTAEYTGYTVYDPLIPVSRQSLGAVSGTVTPGSDMVMCLSCHRAHGSPYPDMLRFPYNSMQAGGGGADGTGCFKCHTAKDGG